MGVHARMHQNWHVCMWAAKGMMHQEPDAPGLHVALLEGFLPAGARATLGMQHLTQLVSAPHGACGPAGGFP